MLALRPKSIVAALLVSFGTAFSAAPLAQTASTAAFNARLSGVAEVPPGNSPARGFVSATLDRASGTLRWRLDYSGLTGPATAAHFHGPAIPGENAGVVVPMRASPGEGEAVLSPIQANELIDGKWYVNIHTAAHPDGEIRGQVLELK